MAWMAFDPTTIKPTALALNILVAAIGSARFLRAGLLTWRTFYPFGVLGAPFSIIGGALHLPAQWYQSIVGVVLLLAAVQMVRSARGGQREAAHVVDPPFWPSLAAGGAVGFVAGVTGAGGGIFLAPLILLCGWVSTRRSAAVSAAFNLLNSAAALAGAWATLDALPRELPWWLVAVGIGGAIGSWLGAKHLPANALRYILALLLLASGTRMVVG
jgi:uncharacterized protein